MSAMKPKIAFFDFASCEGCQLALLNCEDVLLELLEHVELVEFREAMSEKAPRYDIAFIEGSIHREEDVERLHDIRARTRYLVALGACADTGNVQARANAVAPAVNFQRVYGEEARNSVQADGNYWPLWAHTRVRAVHEVVAVDYTLRGCPMVAEEFLRLVKALISGRSRAFPPMPCASSARRTATNASTIVASPVSALLPTAVATRSASTAVTSAMVAVACCPTPTSMRIAIFCAAWA